jgi:type II secretory pathway component PulF
VSLFTKPDALFEFTGILNDQERTTGFIRSPNKQDAVNNLQTKNIQVIHLKRQYFSKLLNKKIKPIDLWLVSNQLFNTLQASIPLTQALSIVKKQSPKSMRPILNHCLQMVTRGKTLSDALSDYQALLPKSYLTFIESGEMNGDLSGALKQANALLLQKIQLGRLFKKALTYPMIIVAVTALIITGMIHFIIPQFQQMYNQMDTPLPITTQVILHIFDTIQSYAPLTIFILLLLATASNHLFKKNVSLKIQLQKYILKLPQLGRYLTIKEYIQWLSLMGALLQSGIPMKQCIQISQKTLSLAYYKIPMQSIIQQVEEGHALSDSLLLFQWMNSEDLIFIKIGETNGELGKAISQQAALLQNQITEKIENITRLLEPLILVILALVMGTILIALYLPLFQMGQLF